MASKPTRVAAALLSAGTRKLRPGARGKPLLRAW